MYVRVSTLTFSAGGDAVAWARLVRVYAIGAVKSSMYVRVCACERACACVSSASCACVSSACLLVIV